MLLRYTKTFAPRCNDNETDQMNDSGHTWIMAAVAVAPDGQHRMGED